MERKALLESQLVQTKAKVYDLNMMQNTLNSQIQIFNNQIVEISNQISQIDEAEKNKAAEGTPKQPTAGPVADAPGADKESAPADAAKPADDGGKKEVKGKPAGNKGKGNRK